MLEQIVDILKDTVVDGLKLLPFLFFVYLIMEYLEHKTGEKTKNVIKKSGKIGPVWGGILGVFPQCGFSAVASNLYAVKLITAGTLIAVYLSTSDEMLPILISENVNPGLIFEILGIKLLIGIIVGFIIDIVGQVTLAKIKNNNNKKDSIKACKENENENKNEKQNEKNKECNTEEISHICHDEHCHCDEDGILKSSIKHTLSIFAFIFIITLALNSIIEFVGEENISNLVLNMPIVGPIISGLVGLIPNCAGSVVLTELYLNNAISLGSMIGGLLVGSGVGMLVLFRVNKDVKDNFKILFLLYAIGVICGIALDFIL